ncbi:MAG: hypothetical protein HZA93_16700 [Verrucomicrobia bacterium]|nr:hypothetical protein [Verrucomicrobiota bacterium]
MKKIVLFLLGASLLLNAALGVLVLAGSAAAPPTTPAARPAATRATLPAIDATIWPTLQAGTLPELVRNLRQAGFPPEVVRAVAAGRIEEIFAARMKALFPGSDQLPFWKNLPSDPAFLAASAKLNRERQVALREALGPDADPGDPMRDLLQGRRVDGLPPDKATEIRRILGEFDDKRSEIYATGTSSIDREKIVALDRTQREAIARVLTAPELEEFDLRNSNTARSLRTDLFAFNPTEEEFRTLFRLRQPFDEKFSFSSGMPSPEVMRERNDAQRLLNEQIKAAFGAERYAEYERTTSYDYRQTSQLVARLELPADTTRRLWDVQQAFQQRRAELYRGVSTAEDRAALNARLATLQTEALAQVTPLLGSTRAVEAYRQYGGMWITNLVPRPPPPRN